METIKNLAKNMLDKGKSHVYHAEQNKEAYRMLHLVEAEKGKLSAKNKKLCQEYAIDVFGDKIYAPWLMSYCVYTNEFKEGWIPDNFYGEYVVPAIKGDYGLVCNRAAIINRLLDDKNSLDIGYFINDLLLNPNYDVVNLNDFKKLIFNDQEKVVFKIENSLQGKGVYFFDEQSFDINKIKKLGNGVFQRYIVQHPFYNQFNSSAVATIRLTSVCTSDGNIEVRAGYFRFGRENDTHVISSRQMRIPLNVDDGTLLDVAFYPKSEMTKTLPDNDINFAGMKLPFHDLCISEIKRLHSRVPFIGCIGWDVIVDENNKVKIIELNGGHNGITFNEMVQGPCFKGLNWESLKAK